jgi:TolA-binding protein
MDRKEFVVILVLCALVGVAATARLSGMTPALSGRGPDTRRRSGSSRPQGDRREPGEGLGRLIWPPQRKHYLPRGAEASGLFNAAERIFVEGLSDAAIATYRRFIQRFPRQRTCEIASFRIGQCLTLSDRHVEAAAHYEIFLRDYPDSDLRPLALLWSGIHQAHLGRRDGARARFQEVIDRHPDTPFAEGARQRLTALDQPPAPATSDGPPTP